VLADESVVTIDDDGRMTRNDFHAVKVLTREGHDEAVAHAVYNIDSEKVKELRAWLISPTGKVKKYGKSETAELPLVDNDVYNEAKRMIIVASADAEIGSIFGYETVTEDRSVFSQLTWYFQGAPLPVVKSRISVTLPRGWYRGFVDSQSREDRANDDREHLRLGASRLASGDPRAA